MAIALRRSSPTDRFIELGGGSRPVVHPKCLGGQDCNVDVRTCYDPNGNPTTDFTADFDTDKPLPITSDEWDGLFCQFCLEHISWRNVKIWWGETYGESAGWFYSKVLPELAKIDPKHPENVRIVFGFDS